MKKIIYIILLSLIVNNIFSQSGLKYPKVIHKLSELRLPDSMVKDIRNSSKKEFESGWNEDYNYSIIENKIEYSVRIMLRYLDGCIIGAIKKIPLMQTNIGEYYKTEISIPIEWCALDKLNQEHCFKNYNELKILDSIANEKYWYQKLEEPEQSIITVSNNLHLLLLLETKSGRKKNNW